MWRLPYTAMPAAPIAAACRVLLPVRQKKPVGNAASVAQHGSRSLTRLVSPGASQQQRPLPNRVPANHQPGDLILSDLGHRRRARLSTAVLEYTKYSLNPQTLKTVADFGKVPSEDTFSKSCTFLATEASIRLAHMIQEIRALPPDHLDESHISQVHEWYMRSFEDFALIATSQESERDYNKSTSFLVNRVLERHAPVVMTTALGIRALRRTGAMRDDQGMNEFLDRFFMSRIAIRFLFQQHLTVFNAYIQDETTGAEEVNPKSSSRWVGAIDQCCNVAAVARHAAESARLLCEDKYLDSPEVIITTLSSSGDDGEPELVCVPSHLYHIMFELFKNSCRAVTEFHDDTTPLPPIEVTIVKGTNDLGIRISDRGGGISQRELNEIFSYHYSTAEEPSIFADNHNPQASDMNHAPLAGFGYGLPVSRLYARYFGGDLTISSLENHGTDAYVHLRANPLDATEVLPSASSPELSYTSSLKRPTVKHWQSRATSGPP